MQKVVWDESFNCGMAEIDKQHKELVTILNEVIEKREDGVKSETVSSALMKLINYADYHFKAEEEYMKKINYPEYINHKREHIEFMRKTVEICEDTMEYKENVPEQLIVFIKNWVVNHIMQSDRDIFIFSQKEAV